MKRYLHLLLTLMLLSVCTVGGAQTTVTYTVLNKSEVSSTDAPTGTTATYTSTYDTKYQLTKDNSMTLTLSGYAGKKITGLKLHMGSNMSSGAGYLDAKVGSNTLASLGSSTKGVNFNKWYNNTSYSSSYNDVIAEVNAIKVGNKENIVIVIGATKNSLYVQSFTLTYEKASNKNDAGLSFSETTATAKLGETFNAPELTNPYGLKVTYTSSNESVATVDATGAVTPVAVGTTTITAKSAETETYDAGEASYTLTVKDNSVIEAIFTETFDNCEGTGGNDGNWSGSIATSTLTADNTGWSFTNGGGANKCAKFGTSSKQGSATTPSISLTGNGTLTFKAGAWKGDATTLNISATGATLSQSSVTLADSKFTDYSIDITNATGSVTITFTGLKPSKTSKGRFFLDEVKVTKTSTKTATQLTFTNTGDKTYTVGDENNAAVYRNPAKLTTTDGTAIDGTITYTSNNPDFASVESNGDVLVNTKATGSATITATYAGNDTYEGSTASYKITVAPKLTGAGTEANPYTVADVIALNNAGQLPKDSVYVKGIVSQVDELSTKYGNATYYISDDGTTTDQFEIYRGKYLKNAKFTSEDQLKAGWTVTVKGIVDNSKTLEMNSGNYITNIEQPSVNEPSISGSTTFLDKTTVTITADEGCVITYTTDGSNPATASGATTTEGNTATIELSATTTVKAVATDANANISVVAEQTFTKLDESSAISVADALTTADKTVVLVKGKVTRTDSYNSSYDNINYYLSDDGTATSELEVYHGLGLSGAKISSDDDIARGDEVYVYGTLTTYGKVKEFSASSIILKQTKAEDKATISDAGWATYVTVRSVDFSKSSDVKAFTVAYSSTDDKITLTPITASVPGNTAVVLKGNAGDYTFTQAETAASAVSNNDLTFYSKATEIATANTVYILAKGTNGVGFYPATVNTTLAAYKGYLSISSTTTAKNFFALDDTATGINSINADKANTPDVRFNLAGQRVGKDYKGVVVVNGKKMLVK